MEKKKIQHQEAQRLGPAVLKVNGDRRGTLAFRVFPPFGQVICRVINRAANQPVYYSLFPLKIMMLYKS